MNKKAATERLRAIVMEQNQNDKRSADQLNWMEHNRLVRGNAVRVYEGMSFNIVEKEKKK